MTTLAPIFVSHTGSKPAGRTGERGVDAGDRDVREAVRVLRYNPHPGLGQLSHVHVLAGDGDRTVGAAARLFEVRKKHIHLRVLHFHCPRYT